jgi:hypothetical protein
VSSGTYGMPLFLAGACSPRSGMPIAQIPEGLGRPEGERPEEAGHNRSTDTD